MKLYDQLPKKGINARTLHVTKAATLRTTTDKTPRLALHASKTNSSEFIAVDFASREEITRMIEILQRLRDTLPEAANRPTEFTWDGEG